MTPAQRTIEFFVKQGWTAQQSAGIVANLVAESNLNPAAVGDGGKAYGAAQWHPPRQAGFQALFGKPIQGSTLEEQLYWVHAELRSTEKAARDALAACTTAAEAGAIVSKLYERPADREGEATKRAALAERLFQDYGGTSGVPGTPMPGPPAPDAAATPSPQPEKPMGALALLQMFAPMLSGMIPQITTVLTPGSKGEKYAGIAQVILDTINRTTGQPNLQGSVEAMQADPAVKAAVQAAVVSEPAVMESMRIVEIGDGIAGARKADAALTAEGPFWKTSAVFYVSLLLLPLVYWLVGSLIVGGYGQLLATTNVEIPPWAQAVLALFGPSWTGEARSGGFNLVIGLILGGICGVYYGVSVTQAKATQTAADNKL